MKAISLWQPWASALFAPLGDGPHAIKLHETRGWTMPKWLVNQPVAIHAAKRDTRDEREFWQDVVRAQEGYIKAFAAIGIEDYADLPRGAIIGEVTFTTSRHTTGQDNEPDESSRDWGNYSVGRFSWPIVTKKLYNTPIPCVGRQGFFDWFPTT